VLMHELRQGTSTPASRKPSAAEEAFAGATIKAFNHNAAATWAGNPGIGCIVRNSSFHVSHMSAFGPEPRIQTFVQNVFNEAAHLILSEYKNAFCPDETCKAKDSTHDFGWHRSFERAGTNEYHDIVYLIRLKTEEVSHGFDVHVVLEKRVLKSLLKPVNHLRPLCPVRLTEYPPFYVLGFNHEYSVWRNDQVVDLGGFAADR